MALQTSLGENPDRTHNKVALITGAAQGIGRATALEFAGRGYAVSLTDVRAEDLMRVAEEVHQAHPGTEVFALAVDLGDLSCVRTLVERSAARFGRMDVLVNNAAWRELVSMDDITVESWERTLRVCLTAPAFLSREVARYMSKQQRGVIINVGSIMAERAGGVAPAYVAAKGAIRSLTFELAALYARRGIRVLCVSPGAVDTQLSRDYTDQEGKDLAEQMRSWSEDAIPLGRWGQPAEIARFIVLAASEDASYLTGTELIVDGGWSHGHFPYSLQQRMTGSRTS